MTGETTRPGGRRETLSGWGRYPRLETELQAPRDLSALRAAVASGRPAIARGAGRAYGDSAVGAPVTLSTRHLDRLVAFDRTTGQLVAEAGVTLGAVIAALLPRGWFPMVTPGTKFVTLGGAIAADVHGKNHHRDGAFRACVDWVEVMGPDGEIRRASRSVHARLFDLTLGGMGLTGVITRAAIRLRPVESGWIRQTTRAAPDLRAAMAAFEEADHATYSVAWIDGLARGARLGRSLVMLGEHAALAELPPGRARRPFETPPRRRRTMPVDLPAGALNRVTVGAFNAAYWRLGRRRTGPELVGWDSYFYPLDAVRGWNRIYGRRGFVQFQCVLPHAASERGLTEILETVSAAGAGSFLAVLKRLGPGDGAISFPMAGYTLALDFPAAPPDLALVDRLDAITRAHGGRVYLAKDARMAAADLRACDPRAEAFARLRAAEGWQARFRSAQSERLSL